MKSHPKVNILYSGHLDEIFTNYLTSDSFKESTFFTQHKKAKVLTQEEIIEKHKFFHKEWQDREAAIFEIMQSASGLQFTRNTIDVYLVRVAVRTFANPIVITASISTEAFFSLLIHELLHRLLKEGLGNNLKKLYSVIESLYPNESASTIIHIPIYALQFIILESVFSDAKERIILEKNQAENFKNSDYKNAIEIVERIGPEKILEVLKRKMAK